MRAVSLQYHDVVAPGAYDASGFPGPGPASYKLEKEEFARHVSMLSNTLMVKPAIVSEVLSSEPRSDYVLLTFDDGGISAAGPVMDILGEYGWKAHFFIATNYIGAPTFLTKEHIRGLRARGHVIGSHSCSHPQRMTHQRWGDVLEEWQASMKCLCDILGEEVTTASVPHGYFSRTVAEAAGLSGVKALFTSEPVREAYRVGDCIVFGRYVIRPGMDLNRMVRLARGYDWVWRREFLFWNAKKIAKAVGGQAYLKLRSQMLHQPPS